MSESPVSPIAAAGYVRVSDAIQDKEGTPMTQRQRIEAYAVMRSAKLGRPIHIVSWYQDVYTGGDSYYDKRRQGFQDLRKAVARREYGMVLAYKDDRSPEGLRCSPSVSSARVPARWSKPRLMDRWPRRGWRAASACSYGARGRERS
jgi:hypothetical protein